MLDARKVPDTHDWRDGQGTLTVARVIGGCSAHNVGPARPTTCRPPDGRTVS
jgi:hypothetical protein